MLDVANNFQVQNESSKFQSNYRYLAKIIPDINNLPIQIHISPYTDNIKPTFLSCQYKSNYFYL